MFVVCLRDANLKKEEDIRWELFPLGHLAEGVDFVKNKKNYEHTNGQGKSKRRMCKKFYPLRVSIFGTKVPGP